MVCRDFILPEICKPCLFLFLRNLFYLIQFRIVEADPYRQHSPYLQKSFEDWLRMEGLDDESE